MTQQSHFVTYNFEFERTIRIGFIGAGGHSFRNVYPTFQYAPIDLVAVCDQDGQRAKAYARQFGAKTFYTDYHAMMKQEELDAVFIVTAYHPDGRVQATDIALEALRHGLHVWMEKPTAASVGEVQQLIAASHESGKYVMTGLKKIFFPAIEKVKEIVSSTEFGEVTSMSIRYPQSMPPFERRSQLPEMRSVLDHIFHPAAIIHYLMGKIGTLQLEREPVHGASLSTFRFLSGAIGTLHMAAGASGSSPLERLEIIGEHANVVVDNGVKVTYYRKTKGLGYGRSSTFLVDTAEAALHWEPEFSLGQLYNKNIFMLGYVQEVNHFCNSVLEGHPPTKGKLDEALEIVKLFEAYCRTPDGEKTTINKESPLRFF
ncbi:Gfo/Idh/MocA family protein [Paenibacillus sp. GCM10023252]|uniref:Gfo/Idh/MocA family protein n=1 Tax=Paenibacillus sp. GCM10023252 TaxID=3252649 RepID=UPI00362045CC